MNLTLRTYTPEDFETLYAIDQACYEPAIAYSRRELRNYLRFPGADCLLAETDGQVLGFCLSARRGEHGHIITMDVLEAYRRRGAGSALLAEAEKRLAAWGVREVGLETATGNHGAIAFWQKHGYRTRGILPRYYPGGGDAFAMVKSIGRTAQAARESH